MSIEGFPRRFEEPQKKPDKNIGRDNEHLRNTLKKVYSEIADKRTILNEENDRFQKKREEFLRNAEEKYGKDEDLNYYRSAAKKSADIKEMEEIWAKKKEMETQPIGNEGKIDNLRKELEELINKRDRIDEKLGLIPAGRYFDRHILGDDSHDEELPCNVPLLRDDFNKDGRIGFEDNRITGKYVTPDQSTDGMVFEIRINLEFNGETTEPFTVTTKDGFFEVNHTISHSGIPAWIKNIGIPEGRRLSFWSWNDGSFTIRKVS